MMQSVIGRETRAPDWLVLVVIMVVAVAYAPPSLVMTAETEIVTGRARVIDGDTLDIGGARIRIVGIDAVERGQSCTTATGKAWACGLGARDALVAYIGWSPVSCRSKGRDRYRRLLGVCRVRGDDVGQWMVRQGWAVAYGRGLTAALYRATEWRARIARAGIWAGSFTRPDKWRQTR